MIFFWNGVQVFATKCYTVMYLMESKSYSGMSYAVDCEFNVSESTMVK